MCGGKRKVCKKIIVLLSFNDVGCIKKLLYMCYYDIRRNKKWKGRASRAINVS